MKLIHCADTHLMSSQWSYALRGPWIEKSIHNLIDDAHARGVRVITHGGDLVHVTRPAPTVVLMLQRINEHLVEKGMVMICISGNHDYSNPDHWLHTAMGGNVETNRRNNTGIIYLHNELYVLREDGEEVRFYGMAPVGKQTFLSHNIPPCDFLMWHGFIQELFGFKDNKYLSWEEMGLERFSALLTGDIHIHQIGRTSTGGFVLSPGSMEIMDVNEAEFSPQKFAIEVEFSRGREITTTSVPLKTSTAKVYKILSEDHCVEQLAALRADAPSFPDGTILVIRYHPIVDRANILRQALQIIGAHPEKLIVPRIEAIRIKRVLQTYGDMKATGAATDSIVLPRIEDYIAAFTLEDPEANAVIVNAVNNNPAYLELVTMMIARRLSEDPNAPSAPDAVA